MNSRNYLKSESFYVQSYDIQTIRECLTWYNSLKEELEKERNTEKFLKFTDEEFNKDVIKVISYTINIIKAERYRHRSETINGWIKEASIKQEIYDNATLPFKTCKYCNGNLKVTLKELFDSKDNQQVLFMFECSDCVKRQAYYEDGSEWVRKPPLCPECNSELNIKSKHTKNTLITSEICNKCNYENVDKFDFKKSELERKKREEEENNLLERYRDEFCLNDNNGPEYIHSIDTLLTFAKEMKHREEQQRDPYYQKAQQLKKLTIVQLKDFLEEVLTKNYYQSLSFGPPEMGKYVIVTFTVNENNQTRTEYESKKQLHKIIKELLSNTNWRLMSEGLTYRLGILSGRLKAYENETELITLVKETVNSKEE